MTVAFFPRAPPSLFVIEHLTEPQAVNSASQPAIGLQGSFSCLLFWKTGLHANMTEFCLGSFQSFELRSLYYTEGTLPIESIFCVCLCRCVHVCMLVYWCVCRGQRSTLGVFFCIHLIFYNRMAHRTWRSLLQLEWLASELQGSSYVHLRHYDDKCVLPFLAHVGAED